MRFSTGFRQFGAVNSRSARIHDYGKTFASRPASPTGRGALRLKECVSAHRNARTGIMVPESLRPPETSTPALKLGKLHIKKR
jgi:hypothetical protein